MKNHYIILHCKVIVEKRNGHIQDPSSYVSQVPLQDQDILNPENAESSTESNDVDNQITITKIQIEPLTDNDLLNDDDFKQDLYEGQVTRILQTESPATFQLTTSSKTKVNISSEKRELLNRIIPADTTLSFTFDSTLSFDFYSASHLKAYINNQLLDKYFTQNDSALRGSYNVETSQLYVRYYRHR